MDSKIIDVTSEKYYVDFKEELEETVKNDPKLDNYFLQEFGVDVMGVDFPDLDDKVEENFVFDKVRGNTRLIDKAIMTHKESEELLNRVESIQF